jgi:hypothetical protein
LEGWFSGPGVEDEMGLATGGYTAASIGRSTELLGSILPFSESNTIYELAPCTAATFEKYAGWNSQSFISQGRLFLTEPPLPTILPTAESTQSVYSQLHVSFHNMTRDSIAG